MNVTHSELPWSVYGPGTLIRTASGEIVADTFGADFDLSIDRANAAMIVKAVNAHSQLIAALNAIANDGMDARQCMEAARAALRAAGEPV